MNKQKLFAITVKIQRKSDCGCPAPINTSTTPVAKAQGTFQKSRLNDFKTHGKSMILSPRNDKEASPMTPEQYGCLSKDSISSHADMEGEISLGPTPRQRTAGNKGMLRAGETVFPRDEPSN